MNLRAHIADVLRLHIGPAEQIEAVADALLADPTLLGIINLAAFWMPAPEYLDKGVMTPEMLALLVDWQHTAGERADAVKLLREQT